MKTFPLKAFFAALITFGLVVAGATLPASASPVTITLSASSQRVYENSTTPAFSAVTSSSGTMSVGSKIRFMVTNPSNGQIMPLPTACTSSPSLVNCKINAFNVDGVSTSVSVSVDTIGVGNVLAFTLNSALTGTETVGLDFLSGAFNTGTQGVGTTNFVAEISFVNLFYVESGTLFVRAVAPTVTPNPVSISGTTANATSSSDILYTGGLSGSVTYSTDLQITGYNFSSSTGRYTRNSSARVPTVATGTITATDSSSPPVTATTTVNVNITQAVPTLTRSGSSSVTATASQSSVSTGGFTTSGFDGQVTYSASLTPSGLSFNTMFGTFSGVPNAAYTGTVTITGTDAYGGTDTETLSFNISAAPSGGGGGGGAGGSVTKTITLASGCYNNVSIIPSGFGRSDGFWGLATTVPSNYQPPAGLTLTTGGNLQGTLSSALTNTAGRQYRSMYVFYFVNGTTVLQDQNAVSTVEVRATSSSCSSGSGSGSGSSLSQAVRPSASLSINVARGARLQNAPVPVQATGLQPNAPFTVEVHSTPVVIATGTVASDGSANYTAAIPSGLEAGWHTMIFTSTASDGTSFTSSYYFKVAGDGTLLSTSETIPAELAYTGSNGANVSLLLLGGLSLAFVGAEMFMIARRKRSN